MSNFIGEQIGKLRTSRGMSQAELSEALGFGKSAIGMYERGERVPNQDRIEAIADFFNVSPSQITDRTTVGEKTKSVVIDGLSEAEIGFLTQFHLFPKSTRSFALSSVEALLQAALQSPGTQGEEHET